MVMYHLFCALNKGPIGFFAFVTCLTPCPEFCSTFLKFKVVVRFSFYLKVILPHLVFFKDYYCISMRSKFGCRICRKKSSNSGFDNAGSSENCLCRPWYAQQIHSCSQTISVQTQTEEPTDNFEEGMYFQRFFELIPLVYFEKLLTLNNDKYIKYCIG